MTELKPQATGKTTAGIRQAVGEFAGDIGALNLKEAFFGYVAKVRRGDPGALPALLGVIVLLVVFSTTSPRFFTVGNLANLPSQAGGYILLAMGLVFVLLLGEIDLSAGTASGVCAAAMALGLNHNGNLYNVLKGGTFGVYLAAMVFALGIAVWQRLWPAAIAVGAGTIILAGGFASNQPTALLLAVCTGTAIGVVTGFLVAKVGIPSFVVTLALFLAWQGVVLKFIGNGGSLPTRQFTAVNALANKNIPPAWSWLMFVVFVGGYGLVTTLRSIRRRRAALSADPLSLVFLRVLALIVGGGLAVYFLNQQRSPNPKLTSVKGTPWVVLVILLLLVALTLLLTKTAYGRHLYAVGGNAEAARRAGIDVARMRLSAFAICSTLAGCAGVAFASKIGGVPADAGSGNTLLYAVGAAVIGGTSLFGGRGRVRDAVLGGLVIALIPNGLGLHPQLGAAYEFVITGLFLLLAAAVDALARRRQAV
ncbi:inner-membrane translocator [Acidothermus cellulolyticus 11B]|uniref:Xylose transport system permease protein XylH n=1 Tax=Acidothermus cellulolyticus (strain ATCC 43068 / DSM 8971 / 11B) TaxID=351607 RepID=A0LTZ2_ACIC1|nr:inner-membrane translocator [Acidothermus cellulolyticus]ABK52902.1 inner-membrane translocator [Acidothermus cellulolyticus 11B]